MQKVVAESDARGEDDLSGREAEVMRFQVALEGISGWGLGKNGFQEVLGSKWQELSNGRNEN